MTAIDSAIPPAAILIQPTVGRQVWYRPNPEHDSIKCNGQPLAATIACVWNDRCVNLQVLDANGTAWSRTSVLLMHGDEQYTPAGNFCEWMPFQKGQAKAHSTASTGEASTAPMVTALQDGQVVTGSTEVQDAIRRVNMTQHLSQSLSLLLNTDLKVEELILAKGKTAPRITPADLQANIVSEHYFTAADGAFGAAMRLDGTTTPPADGAPLGLLTFCVLVLRNGFTVTGESACASPENFDSEIGRRIARENAEQKIWPLMGYHLKQQLSEGVARPRETVGTALKTGHIDNSTGIAGSTPTDIDEAVHLQLKVRESKVRLADARANLKALEDEHLECRTAYYAARARAIALIGLDDNHGEF